MEVEGACNDSGAGRSRLRRFLIVASLIFVFIGGLLSLLPYAIEKGAVSWLQQHGVDDARIANVDLNLFTGEALVEGLKSGDGLNIDHLSVDFDWLSLWHHIVHIRTLKLSKSNLHVLQQQGLWQVAGIHAASGASVVADTPPGEQESPWLVVVDDLVLDTVNVQVKTALFACSLPVKSLHLSLSALHKQQQKMVNHIEIGDTTFSGFGYKVRLAGATMAAEITFRMHHNDILASLQTKQMSLALQGLELQDKHDKRQIRVSELAFDGIALADKDRIHVKSTGLKKLRIQHALNGQGDVVLAGMQIGGLDIGLDGDIAVAKLALQQFSAKDIDGNRQSLFMAQTDMADIASPSVSQSAKSAIRHIRIKSLGVKQIDFKHTDLKHTDLKHATGDRGNVSLKKINLAGLDVGLDASVALARLSLNDLQAEAWSPDNHSLRLEGAKLAKLTIRPGKSMHLKALAIHKADLLVPNQSKPDDKQRLAAFDNASLQALTMNGSEAGSFESLTLEGVQLPADKSISLGSIGRIQVRQARLEKGGAYHAKQLLVDQLQAHLVKQKSGWLLPAGMTRKKPEIPEQKRMGLQHSVNEPGLSSKSGSDAKKSQLVIDTVVLGAGSRIELHDDSVTPPLATTMQIEQFRFAPLDSSGRQRGKLDVQMKLGKSGALSMKGKTNVAAGKQLRTNMHLVLKNYDLPRLSGYVEADLGKPIKTGQLNLDSNISIHNNTIDSKNKVLIRKLALDDSQHAHQAGPQISLAGGMSVDMALDMLLDDRGDVTLNVPVSGPLDDPDINLSHIINTALLASLKTGALTYAALALQPYGSIILVADVARGMIKNAAKPKLTPVEFAERGVDLTSQMSDYIAKIATMMKKKDFRLQVCGIATRIEAEMIMQPAPETEMKKKEVKKTEVMKTEVGQTEPAYVAEPALDDEQLLKLAQQRSDVVVAALRNLGIAGKKVFNCHPGIDEAKQQAQPRVELLLDY